jgi:hypothetical protein
MADGQNAQSKGTTLFETLQIRDLLLAVKRGNEETLETWASRWWSATPLRPRIRNRPELSEKM